MNSQRGTSSIPLHSTRSGRTILESQPENKSSEADPQGKANQDSRPLSKPLPAVVRAGTSPAARSSNQVRKEHCARGGAS